MSEPGLGKREFRQIGTVWAEQTEVMKKSHKNTRGNQNSSKSFGICTGLFRLAEKPLFGMSESTHHGQKVKLYLRFENVAVPLKILKVHPRSELGIVRFPLMMMHKRCRRPIDAVSLISVAEKPRLRSNLAVAKVFVLQMKKCVVEKFSSYYISPALPRPSEVLA